MENSIEFKVYGKSALFTDPLTRMGGEKCSYHIPTYEALKGIAKSIYWKPTFTWFIDQVRIMKPFRTQSKSMKPLKFGGGNDLSIYTYLHDVEYQVRAHFEWNLHYENLANDRIDGKHHSIATRMLDRGGRRDIYLGARECQGYVEPSTFGCDQGPYDDAGSLSFGFMFHGFDYPDEWAFFDQIPDDLSQQAFCARFWNPIMENGIIRFSRPNECVHRNFIRNMVPSTLTAVSYEVTEKDFGL